jgi:hypothetical protein
MADDKAVRRFALLPAGRTKKHLKSKLMQGAKPQRSPEGLLCNFMIDTPGNRG